MKNIMMDIRMRKNWSLSILSSAMSNSLCLFLFWRDSIIDLRLEFVMLATKSDRSVDSMLYNSEVFTVQETRCNWRTITITTVAQLSDKAGSSLQCASSKTCLSNGIVSLYFIFYLQTNESVLIFKRQQFIEERQKIYILTCKVLNVVSCKLLMMTRSGHF